MPSQFGKIFNRWRRKLPAEISPSPISDFSQSEVVEALQKVLASPQFAATENLRGMLRYVVEETLLGNQKSLKAYTIAVDVFGRGENFDPMEDPIVRVQAANLRALLDKYYFNDGRHDGLLISIPKGGYTPAFTRPANYVARNRGNLTTIGAISAAVAVGVIIFFWVKLPDVYTEPSPADTRPQIIRLLYSASPGDDFNNTLHFALTDIASRFEQYQIVTRPEKEDGSNHIWPEDYRIRTDVVLRDGQSEFKLSIQHLASNQIVQTAKALQDQEHHGVKEMEELFSAMLQNNGAIAADYVQRGNYSPVMACSIAMEAYFIDQTDSNHNKARNCAEKQISNGVKNHNLYVVLAYMNREEHSDQRNLREGDPPLQRAISAARKAVELAPAQSEAHYALMTIYAMLGNEDEMIKEGKTAVTLNPKSAAVLAGFGARLNYLGHHLEALEYLTQAVKIKPGFVSWREYALFLANFGRGDFKKAGDHSRLLVGSSNNLYVAAMAITAQISGDKQEASDLILQLRSKIGDTESDLRGLYERRNYEPKLTDKLVSVLIAIP